VLAKNLHAILGRCGGGSDASLEAEEAADVAVGGSPRGGESCCDNRRPVGQEGGGPRGGEGPSLGRRFADEEDDEGAEDDNDADADGEYEDEDDVRDEDGEEDEAVAGRG
jgi:hypothetical protein